MNFKNSLGPNDLTAQEILNIWPEKEIYRILKEYGEERFARTISRGIVRFRKKQIFKTTFDLVGAIKGSIPGFYARKHRHFATKTFQALRIAVNDELNALGDGLTKSWVLLKKEGRLVVITFHSLEDRIVKNFFKEKKYDHKGIILTKKPIAPSGEEKISNPRSRSAKLRAIKKII
jgi:16S rRNA (cytosine1402-N4)-methyltransferase